MYIIGSNIQLHNNIIIKLFTSSYQYRFSSTRVIYSLEFCNGDGGDATISRAAFSITRSVAATNTTTQLWYDAPTHAHV